MTDNTETYEDDINIDAVDLNLKFGEVGEAVEFISEAIGFEPVILLRPSGREEDGKLTLELSGTVIGFDQSSLPEFLRYLGDLIEEGVKLKAAQEAEPTDD